jgi:putative endonuclease
VKHYYVYILASVSRALYNGVTNDLLRRIAQHRAGEGSKHTAKYNIHRLVHVETTNDIRDAIAREKQLKSWSRRKKVELIESTNPEWRDLSQEW